MPLMLTGGSIIQSQFKITILPFIPLIELHKFEAIVYLPDGDKGHGNLQHYHRFNDKPDNVWEKGTLVNPPEYPVTGAGALCQSTYGKIGNFEAVVPEAGGLSHYWCENDPIIAYKWHRTGVFAHGTSGAGAILQNRKNGDLEVVVPRGRDLMHYWRTGTDTWHVTAEPIARNVAGSAAIYQTSYGDNLEIVVQQGTQIVLYFREWDAAGKPWKFGGVVAPRATGAPGFVQGTFGTDPNRNFEVVVPVGDSIASYWRDNSVAGMPWNFGGLVTHGAGTINAVAMTGSDLEDKIEVLAQECGDSIFHYYRYQDASGERVWMRQACLRLNEGAYWPSVDNEDHRPVQSFKINQITGERDHQLGRDVRPSGTYDPGIQGTDLGASFEHNGQLFFLFGDTSWGNNNPQPIASDSFAYTSDTDPWNGLQVYFRRSYMKIDFPGDGDDSPYNFDRQGVYDVPQDGFSFGGQMYVFFSSDHFTHRKVMGRSILTRCKEPSPVFDGANSQTRLRFQYLSEFSSRKFIGVSVEKVGSAVIRQLGLPKADEGLLIWGTGGYRADNVHLAFMLLNEDFEADRQAGHPPIVLYFMGRDGNRALWSWYEEDAVPLFYPAAIGELSVRWNAALRAWVMMYMSGPEDSAGMAVCLRLSRTPWGPWSVRRMVFNAILDGMGKRNNYQKKEGWFIHAPDAKPPPGLWSPQGKPDDLGDNLINNRDATQGGAAYAPYQIPRYTRFDEGKYQLFYVLSTWNPYEVVFMRHPISWSERTFLLLSDELLSPTLNPINFSRKSIAAPYLKDRLKGRLRRVKRRSR